MRRADFVRARLRRSVCPRRRVRAAGRSAGRRRLRPDHGRSRDVSEQQIERRRRSRVRREGSLQRSARAMGDRRHPDRSGRKARGALSHAGSRTCVRRITSMRRLLVFITIAAAAATAGLLSAIHRPIAVNSTDRTLAFDGFPLDRPRLIEFAPPEPESGEASLYTRFSSRANGTDLDDAVRREVTDQIRDWLLITVMSSSRLTADELNQALFDLPPVRRGQFERIAKFDYGETRARAVANGEVVALIPARSAEQRSDALAHIADDERKNTGRIPTTVHVFEYELGADLSHAQITHRASVDGATLFSAAAGYAERRVQSLSDLEQFMSSVDDLTYAQRDGAQLTLGGRRILSRQYRGIRVEDVAAIWQSEQSPEGRSHGSGFSLDPEFEYSNLTRIVQTDLGPRMVRAGAPEVAVA